MTVANRSSLFRMSEHQALGRLKRLRVDTSRVHDGLRQIAAPRANR